MNAIRRVRIRGIVLLALGVLWIAAALLLASWVGGALGLVFLAGGAYLYRTAARAPDAS